MKDVRGRRRPVMLLTAKYLNDLVLLSLVHFPGEAAASEGVVDDEFVGFEARLFEKFGTCAENRASSVSPSVQRGGGGVWGGVSPVYSGAGEVPFEPVSHSLSPFGFASLLGVMHAGELGRLRKEQTITERFDHRFNTDVTFIQLKHVELFNFSL